MAADLAAQLASVVATYLRKHDFSKTLTAFFRENGEVPEQEDSVELETLYEFYVSSQENMDRRAKKLEKANIGKGVENHRDSAEEKANGGAVLDSKKNKKKKEILCTDSPAVPKAQVNKTSREGGSKKKRKDSQPEKANDIYNCFEVVNNGHVACDTSLKEAVLETHVGNGGGLTTQKSLDKKAKKERKELGRESRTFEGTELLDSMLASVPKDGSSKKKRKKAKDSGGEETKDPVITESACKTPIDFCAEQFMALEQQSGELTGCDTVLKKKKRTKDTSLEGSRILKGSIEEIDDAKQDQSKNVGDVTDSKKLTGKKTKIKDVTTPVILTAYQDDNSFGSPEKTNEAGAGEAVLEDSVEKHEFGSAKTPKNKIPSGALAFRRIEVEKVAYSDPRLSDNSYWAKDGAEEGYGAKAQEVLGLVRGRDFRHEKTKKKRGSYKGGFIGMESHSIKFEDSDDE